MKIYKNTLVLAMIALILPLLNTHGDITGKSRREIIEAYGKPTSALNGSSKEILNYPQGQIVLQNGKVSSFKGSFAVGEKPVAQKAPITTTETAKPKTVAKEPAPVESRRSVQPFRWSTTLAEAKARSEKEDRPILALFTGPDWCGPCQQLEAEVLNTNDFKRLGRKKYIPLKIALYRNTYQSPQAKEEYNRLGAEFNIKGVPNFVILDSQGQLVSKPDLLKQRKGVTNLEEQFYAAIEEAENGGSGIALPIKWGVGVVLAGIVFIFFKR